MPLVRGGVQLWAQSIVIMIVLAGLVILWLEKKLTGKPYLQKTRFFVPLCCLFLWLLISTLHSQIRPVSFEGLFSAIIYVGYYYLVIHSVRTRMQQRYFVYLVIGIALFLAFIGLLEYFGIKASWWRYDDIRALHFISSTYGNHNHFAGFLEMVIPLLLSLFLIKRRGGVSIIVLLLSLLLIGTAHLFALSRGGWIALCGSMLFMLLSLLFTSWFKRKKLLVLIGALITCLMIIVFSGTNVLERALTLTEGEMVADSNSRIVVWNGTCEMIGENKLTGTGPSTYEIIFTQYQPVGLHNTRFHYAHNDYLQFIAELGLPVIFFILWFGYVLFSETIEKLRSKSRQTRGFTIGALTGIVAILIHSFVDFNLRIPANALLFISLIALVMGRDFSKR